MTGIRTQHMQQRGVTLIEAMSVLTVLSLVVGSTLPGFASLRQHVDLAGVAAQVETDIQFGSWVFRPRSPRQPGMMKWCRERGLEAGDALVFERLGERRFALRLEKGVAA